MKRLPRLPAAEWPEPLARAWAAAVDTAFANENYRALVRAALEVWFGHTPALPTPETHSHFVAQLRACYAPATVQAYLLRLSHGVAALAPEKAWAWLRMAVTAPHPGRRPPANPGIAAVTLPTAWQEAIAQEGNPLADIIAGGTGAATGTSRKLPPHQRAKVEQAARRFLRWCADTRRSGTIPANLAEYLAHLDAAGLAAASLHRHAWALETLAHRLGEGGDLSWVAAFRRRLRRAPPKKDIRPRLIDWSDLRRLGKDLIDGAEGSVPTIRTAVQVRDGLLLLVLSWRPLRRANLSELVIGRTIRQRAGLWILELPRTKTGTPLTLPLPTEVCAALDLYLDKFRPVLIRGHADGALWLSVDGTALRPASLRRIIVTRTRQAFGRDVSTHFARHILATTIADIDPASVAAAAAVMGHSPAMLRTHYARGVSVGGARTLAALYEQVIAAGPEAPPLIPGH